MSAGYAEPGGSLARLIALRAAERPDFGFVHVGLDGPWSIGTIASAAQALARRLGESGLQQRDRAVVRLGNDERFLAALAAVWQRGASVIAMHPTAPADDVHRVVESMQAAVVVTTPEDRSAEKLPVPVVTLDRLDRTGATTAEFEVPPTGDEEEALILLTSGSTGAPKGVVLSHGNGWSNLGATVSAFRGHTNLAPIPGEVKPPNLVANPVSHTAGVVRLLFALYVGRSVVLLPKFDAVAAKAAIDHYGIDHLTINPTMLRMLLDDLPPDADLGKVRYASSGTAPLPGTLREAFEQRFGIPVLQAYGQTEAFGGIAIESVRDVLAGRRHPGSVWKATSRSRDPHRRERRHRRARRGSRRDLGPHPVGDGKVHRRRRQQSTTNRY
jgi:long-chain acyl-CoA synthetase